MTDFKSVRLNREDFVGWLAQALSGAAALPRVSSSGSKKSTDVTVVTPVNHVDGWPIIFLPQEQIRDLFAFLATYTKVRPFSAFFRVLPLELMSVLDAKGGNRVSEFTLAKCVAGAAMSEAWIASARDAERTRNVFPTVLASLSSALGQTVLAGYDPAVIDWVLREWKDIRQQPNDLFHEQHLDGGSVAWKIMSSVVNSTNLAVAPDLETDAHLIYHFLSSAMAMQSVQPGMLRKLTPLTRGVDFEALLAAPREERINRFNEVIADLKNRSDRGLRSEFAAGLMLAVVGNGAFDQLRSARAFDGWLDGATTWFGICAALFDDSNVLTYGNSVGRRMVRDLLNREDPFRPPRADMNSNEYRFLTFSDAFQSVTHALNSLDIELLPNVMTRATAAVTRDVDRRVHEAELMLRSLEEAGYLIARARHLAIEFTGGEPEGTPNRPSSRRRLR